MKKFKYVGPHPEVEVPALGVVVPKNGTVEVHDPEVAAGFEGQDTWKHVPQSKSKPAAKKAAAKKSTPAPKPEPVATTDVPKED